MNNVFITSDTHFSHRKEFIWQSRGFNSWEEHDEALIQNWNNKVNPNDTIIHCGDVCFQPETSIDKILPRLNGIKTLVMGNHDYNKKLFPYFEKIVSITDKYGFIFTHVPIHPCQMNDRWKDHFCLHGHIHGRSDFLGERYFNVNIELHGNQLLHIDEVRKLIKERKL